MVLVVMGKSKYTKGEVSVKDNTNNDLGEMFMSGGGLFDRPIKHYTQAITVTLHHFYITGEIEYEVDRYVDMLNIIKTCEPHDKIYIYLNTPGGSLTTTMQIISAMNQSAGEITTFLEGDVCSAGTMLFLSGHNYVVNANCAFMIHNCTHGGYGKSAELVSQVKFMEKYFGNIARNIYSGFLTDSEIEDILADKDMWMESSEVVERLKKRGIGIVFDGSDMEDIAEVEIPTKAKAKAKAKPKAKPAQKKKSSSK